MRLILTVSLLGALLALPAAPAVAGEAVDIELVLAVDTSLSVDPAEFTLQRQGLATAFRDPEVQAAVAANVRGVAVDVMLWAGKREQVQAIGWKRLVNTADCMRLAAAIDGLVVDRRLFQGKTAIGNALRAASHALAGNSFDGTLAKIDVSGDGRANEGLRPDLLRDDAVAAGITINGLAILTDDSGVADWYREHVVGGPDAFVMVARDYDDFTEAIRRKLLRELMPAPTADAITPLFAAATP